MGIKFANRINNIKSSEIRELLKLTEKPEIISFAGGLPAPELFPIEEMKVISKKVLDEDGKGALQYSTTEGFNKLRDQIADRMNSKSKTNVTMENILITNGSQQGLDFAGKVFLDEGDIVLCESPSYLGAINAFKSYNPRFIEVPTDKYGMIIDELENIIATNDNIKMINVIPDFQNPTGRTRSKDRRRENMDEINKYQIPVIEDNPYGELRFEGESLPSLKSMDKKGLVVYLGSFSKIFCPGYRIGWTCASKEILSKFILVKQGADLQASSISQREISKFIEIYDLDKHVNKIKEIYQKRRDLMLQTMIEEFPEGLEYTHPEGGLFTWVELPENLNAKTIMEDCLKENVAYVPGGSFFPNGGHVNCFRLNFSYMPEVRLVEGIRRLGKVLKRHMLVEANTY